MEKNDLEKALDSNDHGVSFEFYLEETNVNDFRKHVEEIKAKYSDKGAIKEAINMLNKLVSQSGGKMWV